MAERAQAGRDLPRLQRSRDRLQPRPDSDLRHRDGGGVRARRRGLWRAPGADSDRPSETRRPYRPVGDPAGFRPHHRQQDGRRPRPHRPLESDVRTAEGVALSGDPVRGQRRAISGAVRRALLRARPGDPPRGRELRRAPEGADLGHRRHEPPVAGPARRAHQRGLGQRLSRSPDRGSQGPVGGPAHRIRARGRQRGHRTRDVADRARRDGRRRRRAGRRKLSTGFFTCRRRTPPSAI